jgi:hypothetical protein
MSEDTLLPFAFPAVQRKKVIVAFDGGRLTSDGGVMLLAAAERRLGIADTLAALIADPRDPNLVTHSVADILRTRILAIACGYENLPSGRRSRTRGTPAISTICAPTPASSWPADACRTAATTCARSPPSRAGRTRRRGTKWRRRATP